MPLRNATSSCITSYGALLRCISQPLIFNSKDEGGTNRREYLLEKTRGEVRMTAEAGKKLKLIDTIQRLGIGYYMEDEIDEILQKMSTGDYEEDNLFTTALHFRLLRQNGHHISSDVFGKFMDNNERCKESLAQDTLGLLSLYEASCMGTDGEDILSEAAIFAEANLKRSITKGLPCWLDQEVKQALEVPRHLRMARLEAMSFIKKYAAQIDHNPSILELAVLDYNNVQIELIEIIRWWKQLGLVDKLGFGRDRPLECFLWTVGFSSEPKYSSCRIELAKAIAILLVIDDVFDTYGKMEDLILFTRAIQGWDLEVLDGLPDYMKICYMALYNTNNEICYKILKESGWNAIPYLKLAWIDVIEGFLRESRWFNGGKSPNLDEFIENGISTAGAYMALVQLFFLIGEGVTLENTQLLKKPYPRVFSSAGRILRLWDDLGTAKEEQERGDLGSSMHILMGEKGIATEEEARKRVLDQINWLWKDLNAELISKNGMPLPIVKAALNMARASQAIYKHDENTYLSNVDNYVQALLFTPLNILH